LCIIVTGAEAVDTTIFYKTQKNTTFGKLDLLSSSGDVWERTEGDPVSETLCSVFSRIQDDGRNPKNKNKS
jgi:hypothetical protein